MTANQLSLADKVAIVSGGTRGIGLAIAEEFARLGADVVPTSRTEEDVQQAVEKVRAHGRDSVPITADVQHDSDVAQLIDTTADELGGIDILVNNAGMNPAVALGVPESVPIESVTATIDVNLGGAFRCIHEAAPYLKDASAPSVINVASVGGIVGLPRQHPYVASKHGLVGITKSMALDWAPHIRVNALAPGYVTTELTESVRENEALYDSILERTPLNRFADPSEIAMPAAFLASDAASFITGECLAADGGWTSR